MKTLLIANRGEIARRVIRSARAEGWHTVAIHSDLDRSAHHVREADEARLVPSYLDIGAVVDAAVETGASHVHPGYGFLSERSEFARALAEAGLTLVGPTADVMDAMGRKDRARAIAEKAGVPVVPAYDVDDDPAGFAYPVLVKAAAGGGGKGMRIVRSPAGYAEAVAAAQRESVKAFGDGTLLVEKYVERGRHIEVQVLGDHHGAVVHLFERDCSTQRRHQKVLEEAPAPTLTGEQRERITAAGVDLAREVGYTNAGTVEFLLDEATGEFYFLEMNTRLQVEHPVTEEVVRVRGERVDLVALQLRVATGLPLGFDQQDVALAGHAIEARVYAEDPYAGFLPQAGRATLVRWPAGARVDHALDSEQEVSTAYDPMLGKIVVHGADREAARQAMIGALDATAVLGLTTNTGFLRDLVATDAFRDAAIDTAWLDRTELHRPDDEDARIVAAWTDVAVTRMTASAPHPFGPDSWRLGAEPAPVVVELDRPVRVTRKRVDGVRVDALAEPADHTVVLALDGRRHRAVLNVTAHDIEVVHRGHRFVFPRLDVFADHGPAAGDGTLTAPMPGTVLDVRVAKGEAVEEGAILGTMEAMKMELALRAPFAGSVTEIGASAGEQVALGATLFVVSPPEES